MKYFSFFGQKFKFCPSFRPSNARIFAKKAPVFRPAFYKNEPVWRIGNTAFPPLVICYSSSASSKSSLSMVFFFKWALDLNIQQNNIKYSCLWNKSLDWDLHVAVIERYVPWKPTYAFSQTYLFIIHTYIHTHMFLEI